MRFFAVGQDAVGVIAIGQQATGVIAIGQLATGVVAIGQLARGVVVFGQLAVGIVSVGMLSLGVAWCVGMVGVGATSGGGLVASPLGVVPFSAIRRLRPHFRPSLRHRPLLWLPVIAIAALWFFAVDRPLVHELTRAGGILHDAPKAPTGLR